MSAPACRRESTQCGTNTGVPSQEVRRKPLQYVKCEQCRKDKQGCRPVGRQWPTKCLRCEKMGLPCSEGRRKIRKPRNTPHITDEASLGSESPIENVLSGPVRSDQIGSDTFARTRTEPERLALFETWSFIFSFHKIMSLALDHLRCIERDTRKLLNNDWKNPHSPPAQFEQFVELLGGEVHEKTNNLLNRERNILAADSPLVHDVVNHLNTHATMFYFSPTQCALCHPQVKDPNVPEGKKSSHAGDVAVQFLLQTQHWVQHARYCPREHQNLSDRYCRYLELSQIVQAYGHLLVEEGLHIYDEEIPLCDVVDIPDTVHDHPIFYPGHISHIRKASLQLPKAETDCLGRTWLHQFLDDTTYGSTEEESELRKNMELNIDIEPKELDLKDILGRTTLHIACERGYRSLVERLLERGADVRATTHHGSTPLHIAAASGSLAICELLLNSKGLQSDVHVLDIYGVAPLYYAILHDHLAVYQLLVDRQAFPALQSQPFPPFSKQHLIPAAALGSVKMVEALLNRYNEPNLVDHSSYGKVLPYRHNGWTAMMYATHERKLNVMKLLANSPHIKLDIQDDKGRTALFLAAEEDFVEGVQYLVSLPYPQNQEIGLNLVDRYAYTPLMRAAINGHHEVVKVLLETTGVRYETRYVNCFGSVVDLERLIKDESIMELIREKQRQDAEKQN